MARTKDRREEQDPEDFTRLAMLLRGIPPDQFFGMVSRSGLPTSEARELCDLFRRLKG